MDLMKLYVSLAHNGLIHGLHEFKKLTLPQAFLMIAAFEQYIEASTSKR
jgi:hypothetical protein